MIRRISIVVLLLVIVLSAGAAAFRVYTAPERIRMRLETARETCVKSGGQWVADTGRSMTCKHS